MKAITGRKNAVCNKVNFTVDANNRDGLILDVGDDRIVRLEISLEEFKSIYQKMKEKYESEIGSIITKEKRQMWELNKLSGQYESFEKFITE